MNKSLFTLITIFTITLSLSFSFNTKAADKSLLDTLKPSTKNCNYVDNKLYQPFSDIDKTFPGASTLGLQTSTKDSKVTCIKVDSGTQELLKMLFTTAISIIIILTVINISISGIQYMTQEAVGKKGEAKKRLQNSFVALGLGILSYTILYTVNKQLVDFKFNPDNIDINKSVDKGIASANKDAGAFSTYVGAIEALNQPAVPNSPYFTPGAGGTFMGAYGAGAGGISGVQSGNAYAKVTSIQNQTLMKAMASGGVLNIGNEQYAFRSGGGGEGYLPFGTYSITNCRIRTDIGNMPTIFINGFGYSCDLNDVQLDPRTGTSRDLLRIHPDGGGPGTIGCIGIVGDAPTQQRFWDSIRLYTALKGGSATITVGQ